MVPVVGRFKLGDGPSGGRRRGRSAAVARQLVECWSVTVSQAVGAPAVSELKGLRDDVYRRPLATALQRLGLGPGWRCVDVGAGGGDVSVALAEMVGRDGRVYAVDSDPARPRRGGPGGGGARAGHRADPGRRGPVAARGGRPRVLPVPPPARVRPARGRPQDGRGRFAPGAGWWRRSRSPRPAASTGRPCRCPTHVTPTSARCCPRSFVTPRSRSSTRGPRRRRASGPGPVTDYLASVDRRRSGR